MGIGKGRQGSGLAALVALLCLVPATGAAADINLGSSGGISYVSDSAPVNAPDSALLDVTCPDGTKATGGGFTASNTTARTTWAFPLDGDWRAQIYAGIAPTVLSAYSFCKAGKLRYPENDANVGAGKAKSLKVACPGRTHVTGGGGRIEAPAAEGWIGSTTPFDNRDRGKRPDDGWRITVFNDDDSEHNAQVNAICQRRMPRYRAETTGTITAGVTVSFEHECLAGEPLIGAGVGVSTSAANAIARRVQPIDDLSDEPGNVPDDGIQVGESITASAPGVYRVTAYVICKR